MAPGQGTLKGVFKSVSRMQLIDLGAELRYRAEMMSVEEERGPIYAVISRQSSALTMFHMIRALETQGAYTLRLSSTGWSRTARGRGATRP